MQIKDYENAAGVRALVALVTNAKVLGQVAAKWDKEGLFQTRWENIIGKWCVEHYEKHSKSPGKSILARFEEWASHARDQSNVRLVETFLQNLSEEGRHINKNISTPVLIDKVDNYFNEVRLIKTKNQVESLIEKGEVDKAYQLMNGVSKVEISHREGVSILFDKGAIKEALHEKHEGIIQYPGDAGAFFGEALERESLICLWAPMKRAKTFWLLDMAWRAMLQRKRVVFFEVGDLTKNQTMRRFMIRALHRPLKATRPDKPVKYPKRLYRLDEDDSIKIRYEDRKFKKDVTEREMFRAFENVAKTQVKSKESYLELYTFPTGTVGIRDIKEILRSLDRSGWVPDVICIDYIDLLNHPYLGGSGMRDRVNESWKQLAGLKHSMHCLALTASQTNAASFNADLITMSHFSEDNRKLAHANGIIGIARPSRKGREGLLTLNWVVLREHEFEITKRVTCAPCLPIGNPCVLSCW
jgi:hypothetical protein